MLGNKDDIEEVKNTRRKRIALQPGHSYQNFTAVRAARDLQLLQGVASGIVDGVRKREASLRTQLSQEERSRRVRYRLVLLTT